MGKIELEKLVGKEFFGFQRLDVFKDAPKNNTGNAGAKDNKMVIGTYFSIESANEHDNSFYGQGKDDFGNFKLFASIFENKIVFVNTYYEDLPKYIVSSRPNVLEYSGLILNNSLPLSFVGDDWKFTCVPEEK